MKRRSIIDSCLPPLHLACSNDDRRPAMNCVWINAGIAYATNAHVLAVFDLKGSTLSKDNIEYLHGKLIDKNVWKLLCKSHIKEVTKTGIVVNGEYATIEYGFCDPDMKYPNVILVLNEHLSKLLEPISIFGFDPKLLKIAADIIGGTRLIYHRYGKSGGTFVRKADSEEKLFVLIMPLSYSDDDASKFNFKFF